MKSPRGRLELTWMGKDLSLIPSKDGVYDYEWVDPTDPRASEVRGINLQKDFGDIEGEFADNMLIVGDSGDALRALTAIPEWAEKYRGKVKLVYIDPPFNTDQAFEHYADALEHSVWLTMMRDRIRDIKSLLARDGSIWVHLDDSEVHRMRSLLDEEFGAENFLGSVIWQKADGPRNDLPNFSVDHDTILAYQKSSEFRMNRVERDPVLNSIYKSPDGDPLPWYDDNPTAPSAHRNQSWVYAIQSPVTGELTYPAKGRCWASKQESVFSALSEYAAYELRDIDDAEVRADICGVPTSEVRKGVCALMLVDTIEVSRKTTAKRKAAGKWPEFIIRSKGSVGRKRYQPQTGGNTRTLWLNAEVGHNRSAKAEIKALFPGVHPFSTPKPERLVQKIVQIATSPGDLVLDCFAGSGTTPAVAAKMGRRWLAIELQEFNATSFIIPRLVKVISGQDAGGISTSLARVAEADLPEGVSPEEAKVFTSSAAKFLDAESIRINVVTELMRALRRSTSEDALTREEVATLLGLLVKLGDADGVRFEYDVAPEVRKKLRAAARTKEVATRRWTGGGGFKVAEVAPSMYEVDSEDGSVYLSESATNGAFAAAVAGQLGYRRISDDPVFCGSKGRSRLAVIDGIADEQVVRTVCESLGVQERAVIVAKGILPAANELLGSLSPGSRLRKAPEDLFLRGTVR